MSEISEEATRLIDEFECAAEDAVSDYTMACGASYKNLARHNLEDYIAELEAERRWRVVADGELPELGKEVIFYDSIMKRRLKGCLRKNGGVEWLSDEGYTFSSRDGRYSRITHWMPLPKLPEVQE